MIHDNNLLVLFTSINTSDYNKGGNIKNMQNYPLNVDYSMNPCSGSLIVNSRCCRIPPDVGVYNKSLEEHNRLVQNNINIMSSNDTVNIPASHISDIDSSNMTKLCGKISQLTANPSSSVCCDDPINIAASHISGIVKSRSGFLSLRSNTPR
ncbi:hypothetical protein GJ496_012009 [Pomphorhynchus laevis]|nr:hypothetical protein GJ496_012009 [Pomphorhynchus laevis]